MTTGVDTMRKELAKIFPKDVANFYSEVLRDLRKKNNLKADEYLADKIFEELKQAPLSESQTSWVTSYADNYTLETLRESLVYALSVTASKQNSSVIRKRLAGLLNKALTEKGVLTEAQAEGNFIETNLLIYLNHLMSEDLAEGETLILKAMSVLIPAKSLIRDSSLKTLIDQELLTTFDTLYEVTKIILSQSGTATSTYLDLMDKAKLQGVISFYLSGIANVFEALDEDTQKFLFENKEEDKVSSTIEWKIKQDVKAEFQNESNPLAPNVGYRGLPKFISSRLAAESYISGAEEGIFATILDRSINDSALKENSRNINKTEFSKKMKRYSALLAAGLPIRESIYSSASFVYVTVPDTYRALRFYLDNKESIESSSDTEFELIKGVFAGTK